MSEEEKSGLLRYAQGTKWWLPNKDQLWTAAAVFTAPTAQKVLFKTEKDEFLVMKSLGEKGIELCSEDEEKKEVHKITELPPRNPEFLEGAPDMTTLSYLHEPGILHNLRLRYAKDEIYTYTGAILIALNPWRPVPHIYSEEVVKKYDKCPTEDHEKLPPHVYMVAKNAYLTMRETRSNQTILVSGESGAGKTENCKILMRYLAFTTSDTAQVGEIEQRVLESNPILEAFGNARTLRNDNSSRFGKFTEIQFESGGRIIGSKIETYLLEKSRVVHQNTGERNFHVFYQICRGGKAIEEKYFLQEVQSYHYLNQSEVNAIEGKSDKDEFKETMHAMIVMGINEREQESVLKIVAAILHLGNVKFSADSRDASEVDPSTVKFLDLASALLQIDAKGLGTALCTRKIFAGGEYVTQALRKEQATDARDALSKALYGRLFDWLVLRINASINKEALTESFIGILDIFGFEYFEENSFEQLCINYANEHIQQIFNQHIFKMEQKEYAKEQIKWTYVEFKDNQAVLDVIEGKPGGILSLLDEECMLPKGTDEGFVSKLWTNIHSEILLKNKFSEAGFIIKHFAGDVTYDAFQFLDKNKDALHPDLIPCIQTSESTFTKALFPSSMFYTEASSKKDRPKNREKRASKALGSPMAAAPPSGQKIFSVTVGTQFSKGMNDLAIKVRSTTPYFVRCIKPNGIKKPRVFENFDVAHQLRCAGVLEAIRIMKDMFPSRIPHAEFYRRFTTHEWKCAMKNGKHPASFTPLPKNDFDDFEALKDCCYNLCVALDLNEDAFRVGRTKVFFRTGVLAQLEVRIQKYVFDCASKIRKMYLGMIARRKYKKLKKAAKVLQPRFKGFLARKKYKKIRRDRAARKIQAAWRKSQRVSGFRRVVYEVTRQHYLLKRSEELERRREKSAAKIQACYRKHLHQKRYKKAKKGVTKLQAAFRGRRVRKNNKIQRAVNVFEEKNRLTALTKDLSEQNKSLTEQLEKSNSENKALSAAKEQLSNDLAASETRVSELKTVRQKLEEKAHNLATDLTETRKQLETETTAKNAALTELEEWKEKCRLLQEENRELISAREKLTLDLRTLTQEAAAEKERLESEMSYTKNVLNDEISEKKDHIQKLQEELSDLQKSKAEVVSTLQDTRKTLENTEKDLRELNVRHDGLKEELSREKAETERLNGVRKKLEGEVEQLKNMLEDAGDKNTKATEIRERREKELAELRAELEKTRKDHEQALLQKRAEYEEAQKQHATEVTQLKAEHQGAVERLEEKLKKRKEVMRDVFSKTKVEIRKLNTKAKHLAETTKHEMEASKSALERWMFNEISVLRKALQAEWLTSQHLRDDVAALEDDIDELENRLQQVIQDLVETEKKLSAKIEENYRIIDAKELLEKQLSKGASLSDSLAKKQSNVESDLDEKRKEIVALKTALARAQIMSERERERKLYRERSESTRSTNSAPMSRFFTNTASVVQKLHRAPEASQEADRITKSGWLTKDRKKSATDKRTSKWERRWFVLKPTTLLYYTEQDMKTLKGEVSLDSCTVDEEDPQEFVFKIITKERIMYFTAETKDQMSSWISAIRANLGFNSYLKKTVMSKGRLDRRVGDFVTDYQSVDVLLLEGEPLTLESIVCIQQPLKDSKIHTLSFQSSSLTDLHAQVLGANLSNHSTLATLNLNNNELTDDGAKFISQLITANPNLQHVTLRENKISDEGAKHLAEALRKHQKLQTLSLDGNKIGDAGAAAIVEALMKRESKAMKVLDLSFNEIGDKACIQAFSKLLVVDANLIEVHLQNNKIGDDGAASLAKSLHENKTLQSLDVSDNKITNTGAKYLAKMLEANSTLLELNIGGNHFTSGTEITSMMGAVSTDSTLQFPLLKFERLAHRGK